MNRWVVVPLILFLAIAGLFAFALTGDGPSILPSQLIGKPAPQLSFGPLDDLKSNGAPVPGVDHSDLKGSQPVIVNFWASWCAPCIAEHPFLVALNKETGVPIYGVNYKDDAPNARRFLGQFGNPYTAVGVDGDGRGAIEWGVAKMPETFVLNAKGEIVFKHGGPLSRSILDEKIIPLLNALRASDTKSNMPS